MTFKEYYVTGQETFYTVYTFLMKPVAFGKIFLQEEKFNLINPQLREIFSISQERPSINTFQVNKERKGFLSFGKMQFDGKNDTTWLTKYATTKGWEHYHTDFWIPQKTTALKNYIHPDMVICINGTGKITQNPASEHYHFCNFSIIIKDTLLKGDTVEKVSAAVEKIKQQLYDCYYFHFHVPWLKVDTTYESPDGALSYSIAYQLADVNGAFLNGRCIDYLGDCRWQNIYCDESEIIEREYLTESATR